MIDAGTAPAARDRWLDHGRGSLLGTALGDALGRPFEGMQRLREDEVTSWFLDDAPLIWTDDTAMMLDLAASLADRGGEVDPQHLGDRFAASYAAEPWRGYGAGPPTIFAAAARGTPYLDAAAAAFGGTGSYGNGAAMRAAPAALLGRGELPRVAEVARAQARVTHAHPQGQDGAALLATAVAAVIDAATAGQLDPRRAIERAIVEVVRTDDLWEPARWALDVRPTTPPAHIAAEVGNGIAAAEAVPAAIAAYLRSPHDVGEVLEGAIMIGGDADTIAAMAGALVGATVGAARLPRALLDRLEAHERIVRAADRLTTLEPS